MPAFSPPSPYIVTYRNSAALTEIDGADLVFCGTKHTNIYTLTGFSRGASPPSLFGGPFLNLLSIDDVSAATGLSASTLAKRRCDGSGPPFFKLGRAVKYDRADLDAWILSRRRTSTWAANDNKNTAPPSR